MRLVYRQIIAQDADSGQVYILDIAQPQDAFSKARITNIYKSPEEITAYEKNLKGTTLIKNLISYGDAIQVNKVTKELEGE
ncbi:hypothetical protein [Mycoplasma seminis]|uniref:Uncharacterized protein n=1 Tax=Mycoplasma seminis TaxID=512749 RepID=A0ABY9H9K6_9MOLU|nr:hypothetical protein [Mycoplasma seminis]WLP85269.1 hypothetical protein Q8852_03020 [Mycoplasma seminis]